MNAFQSYASTALVLLVQTTILLLAVFIVAHRLRLRGPATSALVCKAGLIGVIVLLASPLVRLPQSRSLIQVPPPSTTAVFPPLEIAQPPVRVSIRDAKAAVSAQAPVSPSLVSTSGSEIPKQAPTRSVWSGLTISKVVVGLWILGCCFLLSWLVWAQIALTLLKFRSKRLRAGLAFDRLSILSHQRGGAMPELRVHPRVDGAFLFGVLRPTILMNLIAAEELDASDLDLIFEHELAHLRGKDCVWRWIERIACAVLWPQPLLW